MTELSVDEARLVSVRRAIQKFGNPDIINVMDASVLCTYITNLISLDKVEEVASEEQLEYFLDGLILGIATSRLVDDNVPVERLPKPSEEAKKQFQTGVDQQGNVRINK